MALLNGTNSHLNHELNLLQYTIRQGYVLGVNTHRMSPYSLQEEKISPATVSSAKGSELFSLMQLPSNSLTVAYKTPGLSFKP